MDFFLNFKKCDTQLLFSTTLWDFKWFPILRNHTVPYKSSIFQDILDTPYLRFKIPNKFSNMFLIHQIYKQIYEITSKRSYTKLMIHKNWPPQFKGFPIISATVYNLHFCGRMRWDISENLHKAALNVRLLPFFLISLYSSTCNLPKFVSSNIYYITICISLIS